MHFVRANWADEWFDDLQSTVYPVIDKNRKERQKPVRVALLDTGVDSRHPEFQEALKFNKIRAFRGFPASLDPISDRNGHGTHGASVFMRTATNAELYIARIADDEGVIVADKAYAAVVEVFTRGAY
jgi:Subtilase family